LPLAIAQAGAYLQETGISISKYIEFYHQQWDQLMESREPTESLIRDYPNRSIWTTWTISYCTIREKDEAAANLLLLWSFLDNNDLWHVLLSEGYQKSNIIVADTPQWIKNIATNELEFSQAMGLLRRYSLIENVETLNDQATYTAHPVVHKWAYHYQGIDSRREMGIVAAKALGAAAEIFMSIEHPTLQRRALPHVQACSRWLLVEKLTISIGSENI
jgi:hypothetical protein